MQKLKKKKKKKKKIKKKKKKKNKKKKKKKKKIIKKKKLLLNIHLIIISIRMEDIKKDDEPITINDTKWKVIHIFQIRRNLKITFNV